MGVDPRPVGWMRTHSVRRVLYSGHLSPVAAAGCGVAAAQDVSVDVMVVSAVASTGPERAGLAVHREDVVGHETSEPLACKVEDGCRHDESLA